MQEGNKFLLRYFFFTDEVAEHRAEAASKEGFLDIVHSLADIFGATNLGNEMVGLAFAILLEVVHEALLVKHSHLIGQCSVGWLRLRQVVVYLTC